MYDSPEKVRPIQVHENSIRYKPSCLPLDEVTMADEDYFLL